MGLKPSLGEAGKPMTSLVAAERCAEVLIHD